MADPTLDDQSQTQPVRLMARLDRDRLGAPLPAPLTSLVGRSERSARSEHCSGKPMCGW